MKVGISGAGGKLGRAILREMEDRGAGGRTVAISRTPDAAGTVGSARQADYDRPETLVTAYAGLDRLVLIPSADMTPGSRSRQIVAAVDAAVAASVSHIILLSAAGTRRASAPALGEAYWTSEQHLIRTAPTWTIVRMNYYAEAMAEEILGSQDQGLLTGLGDERVAYVSRDDVAAAVAGAVLGEGHAGAIYDATGPAIVTGEERAAIASNLLGKPLGYAVIAPERLRAGFAQVGLAPEVIDAVVDIKMSFVDGHFDVVTGAVERLSGRVPASFRDALARFLENAA